MREFGALEAAIMEQVWALQRPVSAREVLDALNVERHLAYNTVRTVMDKLHRKGHLHRKLVGRAHLYEARATKEEYTARIMREALASSRDRSTTLSHFVGAMTSDDADALRTALRESEGPQT